MSATPCRVTREGSKGERELPMMFYYVLPLEVQNLEEFENKNSDREIFCVFFLKRLQGLASVE